MFQQTFAIIRNTFLESIRQPIMLVLLVIATILIVVANPLSAFTMQNDQRMFIDIGLATVFICGALLAAFIATNVLGREIENRTALTVISKPVSRPLFVIGKYLGVAGALALATAYMSFVFLLVEQHTVLQTVRDPIHIPVIIFGAAAGIIGLAIGIWCNFFYNKVFSSTVICVTTPLAGLAYLFSLMFKWDFSVQPIANGFKGQLWLALAALLIAILVLTAIAVAASTRLGQVMTLCVTIGVFLAGMLSDWIFGRQLTQLQTTWTERVKAEPDAELRPALDAVNVPSLRQWVLDLHLEQAQREFDAAQCDAHNQLFQARRRLRNVSESELRAQLDLIESGVMSKATEQFDRARIQARQVADSIQPPVSKQQAVLTLNWPQTVQRPKGECETVPGTQVFVYPQLEAAVATRGESFGHIALRIGYSIIPNFQVLWLSDALTQTHLIPPSYVGITAIYGLLYIIAALSLATLLFQRREVG